MSRILITGGAGFIGSHLARSLVADGHDVRVLDSHDAQVHDSEARPLPLPDAVDEMVGAVTNPAVVARALEDIDTVYHLAASVGVGQSMYEIRRYVESNALGTAVLMEALAERPIERLVVASSMSVYGEGRYQDGDGRSIDDARRDPRQAEAGRFEVEDAAGRPLVPVPTPETKQPMLESVYALTKYDQERLCLMLGDAYKIPTVALRFFNVYGPGQTLGNPYTGVLAIFATRILNGKPPIVFEDGRQMRDFVHVDDVVQACRLALDAPDAVGQTLNIGSGEPVTIGRLAEELLEVMDRPDLEPQITHRARAGDVRHCFADIRRAGERLGYRPNVSRREGLDRTKEWLEDQVADDQSESHVDRLRERGLMA